MRDLWLSMFPGLHFQDTDIICGYEAGCLGYVPDIKDEEEEITSGCVMIIRPL